MIRRQEYIETFYDVEYNWWRQRVEATLRYRRHNKEHPYMYANDGEEMENDFV